MLIPRGAAQDQLPLPEHVAKRRFREPLKFLPVFFVAFTIIILYCIYVFEHCVPLLQSQERPELLDAGARRRAIVELAIFNVVTVLLLICYVRSILVHPGVIPYDDPQWEFVAPSFERSSLSIMKDMIGSQANKDGRRDLAAPPLTLQETKKSGDRRHCKWCGKFKPDRCHHCRVCKTCILKMDHHCPWIYNCVGFYNYKFFFLLLLYSAIACHFIFWTMMESVVSSVDASTPFARMFLLLFGEILAFFLGLLVTAFFGFHIWLMLKAMTTIEFCEKSLKRDGETKNYDASVYDLGLCGNVRTVLGSNIFLWLLPTRADVGHGLNFVTEETRLTNDMEASRSLRRKTHQKTQRGGAAGSRSDRGGHDSCIIEGRYTSSLTHLMHKDDWITG